MAPKVRGSVKKKAPNVNVKVNVNVNASSAPPQASPGVLVHREDPLAWLKGAPLPTNWKTFASREVVAERRYLLDDICTNSLYGKLQLPNVLTLFDEKHICQYMNCDHMAFPSLTRLFYSSLSVSSDGNAVIGHIGKFEFSFTMSDIVALYETDKKFLKKAPPLFTQEFIETIPDQNELVKTYFIVPNKKPHTLYNYTDILYSMIIHFNILPSKGNRSELTARMIDVLWILNHHTICLAHIIFRNIKSVLDNKTKTPIALPYPCMITKLLQKLGYVFPEVHEPGWVNKIVDSKAWDRSLNAGMSSRMEAFAIRNWKNTEGMVVGGTILPDSHLDNQSRKRRAIHSPVSPTTEVGSNFAANMVVSSRIESSLAALTNLITNMNVAVTQRLDTLDARFTDLQTYVETSVDSIKAELHAIKQDVETGYKEETDVPSTQTDDRVDVKDEDDDEDASFFC